MFPQGTLSGPLIFLLHVNDFSEKLKDENDVDQFADDTSIICKFERNENIPPKIEKILKQTEKYLTENQLTLNADKTEILFFTIHKIRIQSFLLKAKLSYQLMQVVIWEYKLIQT